MKRVKDKSESHTKSTKVARYNSNFDIHPKSNFNGPFPYFRKPKEIGSFSQDENRSFRHDRRQMRYLSYPSNLNFSLNIWDKYETFIQRDETENEYIDHLLRWVSLNKQCFMIAPDTYGKETIILPSLNTDFMCWRGLLTKILCTPYETREGWKIACTKHKGTVYMCEFDTVERKQQKLNQTEKQKVMTYGGYKFEQYLCTDEPGGKPDISKPVNNKEAFCSVVRSRLKEHSLVYGGEVDCCEEISGRTHYVELKTSREIYHPKQDENFKRFKLLKWWAQSFLVGIPKIVCGFRDDEGNVERLQDFITQEIPKLSKDIRNGWEANVCFNFLDKFLEHVKTVVTEDNPRVVYLFEYLPGERIVCEQQDPDSEYCFLPEWYYNPDLSAFTQHEEGT